MPGYLVTGMLLSAQTLASADFAPDKRLHLFGTGHSLPESSLKLYKAFAIAFTKVSANKHFAHISRGKKILWRAKQTY